MNAERPVRAYVGLGSNLGDKAAMIRRATALLDAEPAIAVVARSRLYRTPPWGVTEQDWFVNACVAVETTLPPRALLDRCLAVERVLGRERTEKWGPRSIDLDVLAYGDVHVDEPGLTIPHPHLAERAFVLVPLVEIAPDLTVDGIPVREHVARLDTAGVIPFPG